MATSPNFTDGLWQVVSTKDHQGGPEDDILWRNVLNGAQLLWQLDGTEVQSATAIPALGAAFTADVIGDFDGDSKADIWLRNGADGTNQLYLSSSGLAAQSVVPVEWNVRASTELDGTGETQLLYQFLGDAALMLSP